MARQKKWRDKIDADNRFMRHYFVDNLVYPESYFRFRLGWASSCSNALRRNRRAMIGFFQQKRNASGELGHSFFQKMTTALRMLAYGIPADLVDDHLAMGESESVMCVKLFTVGIVQVFYPEYLRSPNGEDVAMLLEMNKACGFPRMLGSIDCMHWSWKNCPKAWHGQFHDQKKGSTIILEAMADQKTWIWHAFLECSIFEWHQRC